MWVESRDKLDQLTVQEQEVVLEFVRRVNEQLNGQLRSIILYGSRARGEAEADSDMDILVVVRDSRSAILERVRAIRYDIMDHYEFRPHISLLLLSEQDWEELPKHSAGLKRNIEQEGIVLWPLT
jgi:predicted nucleotidyltransferase